jgi:LPPG:FO 2-phospho-L-lactate transferase
MREALVGKVVVGVSPIVHGLAVKGPLAEMIPALAQRAADPAAIAQHYEGLLSGLVVERGDETTLHGLPIAGRRLDVLATETVMKSRADSLRLAREVLDFASGLRR